MLREHMIKFFRAAVVFLPVMLIVLATWALRLLRAFTDAQREPHASTAGVGLIPGRPA